MIIHRKALSLIFFVAVLNSSAQGPEHSWARTYQGPLQDLVSDVKVDPWGNLIIAGEFEGAIDLDPGPQTFTAGQAGVKTTFISKLNGLGEFIWSRTLVYESHQHLSLQVNSQGDIYADGAFYGVTDFDPGPGTFTLLSGSPGDTVQSYFILKLTNAGNFMNCVSLPIGTAAAGFSQLQLDASSNLYFTGHFKGVTDLDPGPAVLSFTSQGQIRDLFMVKFNSSLQLLWAQHYPTTYNAIFRSLAVDQKGNVFVAGFVQGGNIDMDPGPGTSFLTSNNAVSAGDAIVGKYNSAGNLLWAKQMVGANNNSGSGLISIALTKVGEFYGLAGVSGTVDIDPGTAVAPYSSASISYLLMKLDVSGNLKWHDTLHVGFGSFPSIKLVRDSLMLLGHFTGTVDVDPSPATYTVASNGQLDVLVCCLDTTAAFGWATSFGGVANELLHGFHITSTGELFLAGRFSAVVDFNPGSGSDIHTSAGTYDGFLSKFSPCKEMPINLSQPSVCAGNSASLVAKGAQVINWYQGSASTSVISTGSVFVTPALSAGTHTYYASTPSCGSAPRTPFFVVAEAGPSLTLTAPSGSICVGSSTVLQVSGATVLQWSGGPSAAAYTVTPAQNTTYTVTGSDASTGCSSTRTVQVLVSSCAGIEEIGLSEIKVFPNPSEGIYYLETGAECKVSISDMFGRVLLLQALSSGTSTIDLHDFPKGTYVLSVTIDDSSSKRSFLILRQ